MLERTITAFVLSGVLSLVALAQDGPPDEYTLKRWKSFADQKWHEIDFSKTLLEKERIAKLDPAVDEEEFLEFETPVSELALLRGVVFGKRGRIFKDKSIQRFLDRQAWYRPDPAFDNASLTKIERENLDLIRIAEAEKHEFIEPGDMRLWIDKPIPPDKISYLTPAGWRIVIAEIEAIHGRRFDGEPWLQKYFEERYWYVPRSDYSPDVLSEVERSNLELIIDKRNEGRKISVWVGDMDKFQNSLLTEELLEGLTLMELRLIRNEFFARNGYRFAFPGIAQHFEWRDWYTPLEDQSRVALNETEKTNVKLIEDVEKALRLKIATEPITPEMIEGLFIEDLKVLRNEIYARRGRVFKDKNLQAYFAAQPWYKPDPEFEDEMLSSNEFRNLALIKEAEEIAMSRFDAFEG